MIFHPKPPQNCLFAAVDAATGEVRWHLQEFGTILVQSDIVVTPEQVARLNEFRPIIKHEGWRSAKTYEEREKLLQTALAASIVAALGNKHADVNEDEVTGVEDLAWHLRPVAADVWVA